MTLAALQASQALFILGLGRRAVLVTPEAETEVEVEVEVEVEWGVVSVCMASSSMAMSAQSVVLSVGGSAAGLACGLLRELSRLVVSCGGSG